MLFTNSSILESKTKMLAIAFIACLFLIGIEADTSISSEQYDQSDENISNQTSSPRFRRWTSHCSYGGHYCGGELSSMGYGNAYSDYLYKCEHHGNANVLERCDDGCHHDYQRSTSHCHCRPGGTYCGYELQSMNFRSFIESNALYTCDNQHQVRQLRRCSQRCQTIFDGNGNGNARCPFDQTRTRTKCSFGTHYCGFQLKAMGRYPTARSQVLYRCANYKGRVSPISFCYTGCVETNGANARCRYGCDGVKTACAMAPPAIQQTGRPQSPRTSDRAVDPSDVLGGDLDPTDDTTEDNNWVNAEEQTGDIDPVD